MEQGEKSLKSKTVGGIVWSFLERIASQVVSFIVSIVLARLLLPEQYGVVSLVTVIISIFNVFLTGSFSTALIQKKDADETDFSSVFYFNIVFSLLLYGIVFLSAPLIASFYEYEQLVPVIRVMALSLIISSIQSVQRSRVSRDMQFGRFFWSTLGATIVSAVIGIFMAYKGFGVWALVGHTLAGSVLNTAILWFTVRWRPKRLFSFSRLRVLISFGWKVLLQNLLFTVYSDLRTLIIGKRYSTEDLAYYSKGRQFPNLLVNNINTAISSALLPAMSRMQDDRTMLRNTVRRFVRTGSYILMPMMAGLAVVAEPLVRLLLTEKWIACVPFIQLMCISHAFLPLQTANTQAVLASGRSDVTLITEIIKRGSNILIILITFRISVMAMVIGEVASSVISLTINTVVSWRLFGYGTLAQLWDMLPNICMSLVMGGCVYLITFISMPILLELLVQVIVGAALYLGLSAAFRVESFRYIRKFVRDLLQKRRHAPGTDA